MPDNIYNQKSPLGLYFNSNAAGLLQNVLLNTLAGEPFAPDDYWEMFSADVGYEDGGYGINLGYNKPSLLNSPGVSYPNNTWTLTGKMPIDL